MSPAEYKARIAQLEEELALLKRLVGLEDAVAALRARLAQPTPPYVPQIQPQPLPYIPMPTPVIPMNPWPWGDHPYYIGDAPWRTPTFSTCAMH